MSETKPPTMEIIPVTTENLAVYDQLAQGYEAEFSAITGKKPDARGVFALDTRIGNDVRGFLLAVGGLPAGLIAVRTKGEGGYEVGEFYIVPSFRKQSRGRHFAHAVWRILPGRWEIKQIAGNVAWNGGGNYNWQIAGVTGTAGSVSTWDLVSATGVLDLTALTTSSKFNINLWSLSSTSPSDVSGALTGFDNTQNYTWKIATAAGGITNFSSSYFNFNTGATNGTGGFANALNGGSFSLAQSGNDLNLVFTSASAPIPEPGTWAAMAIFAGGAAYAGWRRRKSAKVAL